MSGLLKFSRIQIANYIMKIRSDRYLIPCLVVREWDQSVGQADRPNNQRSHPRDLKLAELNIDIGTFNRHTTQNKSFDHTLFSDNIYLSKERGFELSLTGCPACPYLYLRGVSPDELYAVVSI